MADIEPQSKENVGDNSEENAKKSLDSLKDSRVSEKTANNLYQNKLPDDVDYATKLSNLDNAIKILKEYKVKNSDEEICLKDCINRKFESEDIKRDILEVKSNNLSPEKFMEKHHFSTISCVR